MMLWLLSLPFRIVFSVLGIVFRLVGGVLAVVAGVLALVLLPLALLFWAPFAALRVGFGLATGLTLAVLLAAVGAVVLLIALVPVIPIALVVGSIWLIARLFRLRAPTTA